MKGGGSLPGAHMPHCHPEGCQFLPCSPSLASCPSPLQKWRKIPLLTWASQPSCGTTLRRAAEPPICQVGTMISYLPREQRDLPCPVFGEPTVLSRRWDRALLSLPLVKTLLLSSQTPSFFPREGGNQLSGPCRLILPLHFASVRKTNNKLRP